MAEKTNKPRSSKPFESRVIPGNYAISPIIGGYAPYSMPYTNPEPYTLEHFRLATTPVAHYRRYEPTARRTKASGRKRGRRPLLRDAICKKMVAAVKQRTCTVEELANMIEKQLQEKFCLPTTSRDTARKARQQALVELRRNRDK
jgi:hypothetical protein